MEERKCEYKKHAVQAVGKQDKQDKVNDKKTTVAYFNQGYLHTQNMVQILFCTFFLFSWLF